MSAPKKFTDVRLVAFLRMMQKELPADRTEPVGAMEAAEICRNRLNIPQIQYYHFTRSSTAKAELEKINKELYSRIVSGKAGIPAPPPGPFDIQQIIRSCLHNAGALETFLTGCNEKLVLAENAFRTAEQACMKAGAEKEKAAGQVISLERELQEAGTEIQELKQKLAAVKQNEKRYLNYIRKHLYTPVMHDLMAEAKMIPDSPSGIPAAYEELSGDPSLCKYIRRYLLEIAEADRIVTETDEEPPAADSPVENMMDDFEREIENHVKHLQEMS